MALMSTWALSGGKKTIDDETSQQNYAEIGCMVKKLLNWGRVLRLREAGFDAWLTYYVDPDSTPENTLLVAVPRK